MLHFSHHELGQLLSTYGYWVVLAFVCLESLGLPIPGETILLAAAIYAGTTHQLDIYFVVAAAAAGTTGFGAGREFGYELAIRYGRYIHLDEPKMKLGMYMFLKHGGKVVFFGRFIAFLRAFVALLAGINRMEWPRFLAFNTAGSVIWAALVGFGAFFFGKAVHRLLGAVGIALLVAAVVLVVLGFIALRRNQARLAGEAERAFPGPLRRYHFGKRKP